VYDYALYKSAFYLLINLLTYLHAVQHCSLRLRFSPSFDVSKAYTVVKELRFLSVPNECTYGMHYLLTRLVDSYPNTDIRSFCPLPSSLLVGTAPSLVTSITEMHLNSAYVSYYDYCHWGGG